MDTTVPGRDGPAAITARRLVARGHESQTVERVRGNPDTNGDAMHNENDDPCPERDYDGYCHCKKTTHPQRPPRAPR